MGNHSRKYRGVVPLKGRWGARIMVNRQQVWLGTYQKEKDAAINFDRICLKLGRRASLNFPRTVAEMRFQSQYSLEAIISMVKDQTYGKKCVAFLREESVIERPQLAEISGTGSVKKTQKLVMLFGVEID